MKKRKKNNRRTLTIDSTIYEKFKSFCDKNNFKISKHAEKIISQYVDTEK